MDNKLIEAIVTSKITVDIGKYTKDGEDLDYNIVVPKYDEYTGAEGETESHSVVLAGLEEQITETKKILANLEALKIILADKDIPVLVDYTELIK